MKCCVCCENTIVKLFTIVVSDKKTNMLDSREDSMDCLDSREDSMDCLDCIHYMRLSTSDNYSLKLKIGEGDNESVQTVLSHIRRQLLVSQK